MLKKYFKKVIFYLFFPFIFVISLLPFSVLYIISDVLCFVIYSIFKYRKKVVFNNLLLSFPEKSVLEIDVIAKKYYHHLCDLIIEMVKLCTINQKELLKRCTIVGDKKILNDFFEQKKSCIGVMGHTGNWEWASPIFSIFLKQELNIVYKKLSNPEFDFWINKVRTRFGQKLIESQNTIRAVFANTNKSTITILLADQSPPQNNAIWTNFLHQDTPFLRGPAILAQKFDMPILYLSVRKPKRGFYEFQYTLLENNPKTKTEQEILQLFVRNLEIDIQKQPEIWLWSHRRWKHKRV